MFLLTEALHDILLRVQLRHSSILVTDAQNIVFGVLLMGKRLDPPALSAEKNTMRERDAESGKWKTTSQIGRKRDSWLRKHFVSPLARVGRSREKQTMENRSFNKGD